MDIGFHQCLHSRANFLLTTNIVYLDLHMHCTPCQIRNILTQSFNLTYIKHIEKHLNQERPIVILQDNHSCHENGELIDFCISKGIYLNNFPPKTIHLLQPLDKLFGTFKHLLQEKRQEAQLVQQKICPNPRFRYWPGSLWMVLWSRPSKAALQGREFFQ